jgi:hypothetical protein
MFLMKHAFFLIKNIIAGRTRKKRRLKTAEWKREIINETYAYACDVVITEKSVFYDPYPNMMKSRWIKFFPKKLPDFKV